MVSNEFMRAAHCDLAKVKRMLAEEPGYLDARGPDGETPLGAASHSDQKEIIEFLLTQGVELDFFGAIVLGRVEEVRTYLQADPSLANAKNPCAHLYPALFFAAISGQEEVAELLLEFGADLNIEERGFTPLHGAASFGRTCMAEWLLAHGAEVNALMPYAGTPLHLAAYGGHQPVVDLLLQHGADPQIRTKDGETAADKAREKGHEALADHLRSAMR